MKKIFCFGEILLRFSPTSGSESFDQNLMPVYVGGAELNAAHALALWKLPVKFCTAMPDNFLSASIKNYLEHKKIDTSAIVHSGERLGLYYLEQGKDMKNTGVVFDRAGSSFSELTPGTIKWHEVFKEVSWFHFSAIAASLTNNAAAVCLEALEAANDLGITISVDLNYREKLWKYGKKPVDIMPELVKYCDVVMGNIWAVESLLGLASPINESMDKSENELIEGAAKSMKAIHLTYPKVQTIAFTYRLQDKYFAVIGNDIETRISKTFQLSDVIDKVGSGDCFMAGLIYGLYNRHSLQQVVDFAAAAAVGKLYEKGDTTKQAIEEINKRIL